MHAYILNGDAALRVTRRKVIILEIGHNVHYQHASFNECLKTLYGQQKTVNDLSVDSVYGGTRS